MSRIANFVNHTAMEALHQTRNTIISQRNNLAEWLSRYESDKQCDDEDRAAIADARVRLKRFDDALNLL